ncbi:hypothetical protein NDU88_002163 [Pleurodeles waltl]|uniref:Secreted protein n=1 Tax=Pleurodeles waltl TaxID=8319 RepID=A0AAV7NL87_PLEWA|nr:hypothetical protein NDU88_002163 [Pleurodeles waltl]
MKNRNTEATVLLPCLFGGTLRFLVYAASPFPWRHAHEELFTCQASQRAEATDSRMPRLRFPGDTCGRKGFCSS